MAELLEIFPALLVGIAVVYSVASAAKKAKKKQTKSGKKPPVKVASPAPVEKTPEEQFEEITKKMEAQKAVAKAHRDEKQRERNQTQSDKYRYNSRNKVTATDDTGASVVTEALPKEAKKEEKHSHPGERIASGEKVRVEKKIAPTGSLGADSDEGCEHSDIRYVIEEVATADENSDADVKELQRLVVWSDVLGTPKFKNKKFR